MRLTSTSLNEHTDEPRFDNPYARMRAFALDEAEKSDLIEYLITLR